MQRIRAGYVAGWLCGAALFAGCSSPDADLAEPGSALVGQTGDFTVSGPQVVNQYAALAVDVPAGANSLVLTSFSALPAINTGDVLFLIQTQGALVDPLSDSDRYGEILALGNNGRYEMVTVTGTNQTTSTVQVRGHGAGGGLQFSYSAAAHTQVITVPQYQTLTIAPGGVLNAAPWNGSTGGVVVLTADTVQVDGMISATGAGFRGGQLLDSTVVSNIFTYRTLNGQIAGERGEGVGGSASDYDLTTGRYGRGAAGNGGGGGNSINSPGGGGANGLAAGKTWTGQGVMDVSTANFKTAWMLDPAYLANGNAFADSAGGGRGGYGCSSLAADPLTQPPGAATWACANRPNLGGLGGRPLPSDVRQHLFFGGGGGAGQENNGNGGAGGNGGGLVFVLSRTIRGQGTIVADGAAGSPSGTNAGAASDGPGGGGGGGTVVLLATRSIDTVRVSAAGGRGGNHQVGNNPQEGEGGGGGGGGGFIALAGLSTAQASFAGGPAGTTNSTVFTNFPLNGATGGGAGAMSPVTRLSPDFLPPVHATDLQVTLGFGATQPQGYTTVPGYATVTNLGPDPAGESQLTLTVPAGLLISSVYGGNVSCGAPGASVLCTVPPLASGQSLVVEFDLDLPREPQGPFPINAALDGGGYDYVAANNQATLMAEIFGYVQFSGNGFGGCAMSGDRASGGSVIVWAGLLAALLWTLRRRRASVLWLLLGAGATQGCTPPEHPRLNLQVAVTGQGTVTASTAGIECGAQCQAVLEPGTEVMLVATPAAGQRFVRWDGRCQGTVPQCGLTLVNDTQTTATFEPIPVTCFDGIKNATETDVDCGGSCGSCEESRSCQANADCQSGQCLKGQCSLCPVGRELIVNGGAEAGASAPNSATPVYIPGWALSGSTVIAYGTAGYPATTDPGPAMRGNNFFMGGQVPLSLTSQGVDLRACVSLIKQGALSYTFSAYLGGTGGQTDNAALTADFQNNQASSQMKTTLGPVTPADRSGATGLLAQMSTGTIPVGADRAIITLVCTREQGADNDGYADNISLVLSLN